MKKVYLYHWQYLNLFVKLLYCDGETIFISSEDFNKNFSDIIFSDKDTVKSNYKWKSDIKKNYFKPQICFYCKMN